MSASRSQLLICIDVGNTSSNYGLFKNGRLTKTGRTLTRAIPEMTLKLMNKMAYLPKIHILISSVVPRTTKILTKSIKRRKRAQVWVVGQDLKVPIVNKYRHKNKLGSDRLVNAFGALKMYGAPILIMDFGTALTCDYVSKKGTFEGGLIIPGPEISYQALRERTALLPKAPLPNKLAQLIARDTVSGMKYGILQAYGAMTDGLAQRFKAKYGRPLKVVATGGLARLISKHTREIDIVDPLLTLKSLALLNRLSF